VKRPPKELVGFEKVWLEPKEKKTVSISVKAEDLSFYDITRHDWKIEQGQFKILVGKSSRSIVGEAQFSYE
jgi:beta-glucosidase